MFRSVLLCLGSFRVELRRSRIAARGEVFEFTVTFNPFADGLSPAGLKSPSPVDISFSRFPSFISTGCSQKACPIGGGHRALDSQCFLNDRFSGANMGSEIDMYDSVQVWRCDRV